MKPLLLPLISLLASTSTIASRSPPPSRIDESKLPSPKAPLIWGDVNFVHTTDIHGWLLGHQHATWPEPNYSADTGDLSSFLTHLRAQAKTRGVDLLVIDSGDHHDGSGLVSSLVPQSTQTTGSKELDLTLGSGSRFADHILSLLSYDALAIGNHELYKLPDVLDVLSDVEAGMWDKGGKRRFLTSNVNVTMGEGVVGGEQRGRPVGERFVKFETEMGKKVTALGVLYNFHFNARHTTIQPISEMVQETWFLKAIHEAPDFFVVVGHMSINRADSEWTTVFNAIRRVHPDIPIFLFGGHNHVRNCERLDGNSISFAAGRYMETVGWVSANLTKNADGEIDVSRRYLDSNRKSFKYHAGVSDEDFDTPQGKVISQTLWDAFDRRNLSYSLGQAPQDYFLARYPVTDDRSLLKKLMDDVLPATVYDEKVLSGNATRIYIANSGCQRFDIFKGPFSLDDQFSISPFSSEFVQISLPARIARVLRKKMNQEGASQFVPGSTQRDQSTKRSYDTAMMKQRELYQTRREAELDFVKSAYGQTVFDAELAHSRDDASLYGYVTEDACGPIGSGDDVEHVPAPYSPIPDYVSTTFPEHVKDDESVFVIVMTFFLNDVVSAVHKIDPLYPNITIADFKPCGDATMVSNQVWGHYARKHWN